MAENTKNLDVASRHAEALHSIAVEMMETKDLRQLLSFIVIKAIQLMDCDAASLYLKVDEETIAFEVTENCTKSIDFRRKEIPISGNGIAAYVFRTGKTVCVDDVYELLPHSSFVFDRTFDEAIGYRTRSVLAQPLVSSKGEKLGVIQLLNRKRSWKDPWPIQLEELSFLPYFSKEDRELLRAFSALASASIEQHSLYESIENLFRGFIKASVKVIEERDPATRGHSERVALLTLEMAKKVSESNEKGLKEIHFSSRQLEELNYAALLHDFGKVTVKEATLLKAKKLHQKELELLGVRLNEFKAMAETKLFRELFSSLLREQRAPTASDLQRVEELIAAMKEAFDSKWEKLLELSEPSVLDRERTEVLEELKHWHIVEGTQKRSFLDTDHIKSLAIKRGSLSPEERQEIESHVTNTFHFLAEIPWTKDFAEVPKIAYGHHEKLDGSGYPRGITQEAICPQTRILTICDIYDALVAADRPYKKAVPVEKALRIMEDQVKRGQIDGRLFSLFTEAKIYLNQTFMQKSQVIKKAA